MIRTTPIRPSLDPRSSSSPPQRRCAAANTSFAEAGHPPHVPRPPPWQICSPRTSGLGIDARRCQA